MLTIEQAAGLAMDELVTDGRLIESLRKIRRKQHKVVNIYRPKLKSDFPELFVDIPDSWPHIDIAPLFDVHLGHSAHLAALFSKHHRWLMRTPYVLTFDGGDLIENANKLSVGSGVYEQDYTPDNQIVLAVQQCAKLWHKMLFKLPGNHEARTRLMGVDVARWVATLLEIPYFPDFCFLTLRFAGNNFRILAHHGTGAATTAGAQRMAARKPMPWAKFDILWSGHLHNSLADPFFQTDFDQKTGLAFERNGFVIISPSYLGYWGTYAASKMYPPGIAGMSVARLNRDGRIDVNLHARGRRL